MLFQKMESFLKFITAHNKISAHVSQLKTKQEQLIKATENKTMGQLVNDHVNPDHTRLTYEADVSKEPFISFHIEHNPEYYETKNKILVDMVAERNDLVHHSYLNFDMNSTESCRQIEKKLDNQQDRIQLEIKDLKSVIDHVNNFKKKLADYVLSNEFESQFKLSWLKNSPLVMLLSDISTQIARQDGWASLSVAGKLIREDIPEEMNILEEKYGYKSLKPLILGAGIFDLREEQTKNNGSMLVYRVKPELELLAP